MRTVRYEATRYEINAVPSGHPDAHKYVIIVERTGPDEWAVRRDGYCLGHTGRWTPEPPPQLRTGSWLGLHRSPLDQALDAATLAAPAITVNGRTAAQIAAAAVTR